MSESNREQRTGGQYVYDALLEAGVEFLVGIPGTQTLPLDRTVVERDDMEYVMARHETAVPHVAWGYYEISGVPAATLVVPGPGDTLAMHGLKNAYEDCVPIFHVSADADPGERGKGPIHEIEPDTFDNVVKTNVNVERPSDLPLELERGIQSALSAPYGPVRLGVPSGILDAEFETSSVDVEPEQVRYDNTTAYQRATRALTDADRPLIYVGGGTRRTADGPRMVMELATALDAPVVTSYKGKGVFPEDDPRWLGVTGSHLPSGAERVLEVADVVLALGTDFDGVATNHWDLPFGETLIHVNLDTDDIDMAYDSDISIVADVTEACRELLSGVQGHERPSDRWSGEHVASSVREEYREHLHELGLYESGVPANTPGVLAAVREATPEQAVVVTDVGGFRLWAMQVFETYAPNRFVAPGSWAGMGVGLPAAIGAQLAAPDEPVVCLSGDGGLMMCIHELHTAAEHDLPLTVVVSNNEDYGIISKSPKIKGHGDDHQFMWESPEFVAIAEGFGWEAQSAETPGEVESAVADAVQRDTPVLVEVCVPTDEPSAVDASNYETSIDREL